jgi:hypothetical protein
MRFLLRRLPAGLSLHQAHHYHPINSIVSSYTIAISEHLRRPTRKPRRPDGNYQCAQRVYDQLRMPWLPQTEVKGDNVYLPRLLSNQNVCYSIRHVVADPFFTSVPANDRTVSVALVSNKLATTISHKA